MYHSHSKEGKLPRWGKIFGVRTPSGRQIIRCKCIEQLDKIVQVLTGVLTVCKTTSKIQDMDGRTDGQTDEQTPGIEFGAFSP